MPKRAYSFRPKINVQIFSSQTPVRSLVGFSQAYSTSQQYFSLTTNQHQPTKTSSKTNQRTRPHQLRPKKVPTNRPNPNMLDVRFRRLFSQ